LKAKIEAAGKGDVAALGICHGGKKLFHAQFDLKANGYPCLQAWRDDWRETSSSQIFLVGSKDEASGNQSCRAMPCEESWGFDLRLRLIPKTGFGRKYRGARGEPILKSGPFANPAKYQTHTPKRARRRGGESQQTLAAQGKEKARLRGLSL
jgi:hypothetical protein